MDLAPSQPTDPISSFFSHLFNGDTAKQNDALPPHALGYAAPEGPAARLDPHVKADPHRRGATVDAARLHAHYGDGPGWSGSGNCLGGVSDALADQGIHLDMSTMPVHETYLKNKKTGKLVLDPKTHEPIVASRHYWAKDAGPALEKAGYKLAGYMPLDQVPVAGAVVFDAAEGHNPAGHIQLRLPRGKWGSEGNRPQSFDYPYGPTTNYAVYVPARVINDPSSTMYAGKDEPGHRNAARLDRHHRQAPT